MAHGIPTRLTPAEGRRFGFTVGAAFGVLAAIMFWRGHQTPMLLFGGLATLLLAAGLFVPGRLGPVYHAWMSFALLISKVTTPIFMGVVFFLVIAPVGVLMRLFGRNPIRHEPVDGSYWTPRSEARGTMTNQF